MQRRGRGNGDFFGFGDPFAGFDGFGRPGSLFSGIFGGRDPFDDPFFTRPFTSTLGPRILGPNMQRSLFENPQGVGFTEELPSQPNNPRGPVIRELGSDEDDENGDASGDGEWRAGEYPMPGREPYVQHPEDEMEEDEAGDAHIAQHGNNYGSASGPSTTLPQGRNYTFRSSSVTYGGVNGAYYTSSKTKSTGGDGVMVEESREADVTTGQATHRISKCLHGKGHSLTRKLSSDGRVDTKQTLHNLNEDDLPVFEEAWKGNAKRHLPGWNHGSNMFNTGRGEDAFGGSSLPFRRQQWQEPDRANRPTNPNTNVPSRRRIFIE